MNHPITIVGDGILGYIPGMGTMMRNSDDHDEETSEMQEED